MKNKYPDLWLPRKELELAMVVKMRIGGGLVCSESTKTAFVLLFRANQVYRINIGMALRKNHGNGNLAAMYPPPMLNGLI